MDSSEPVEDSCFCRGQPAASQKQLDGAAEVMACPVEWKSLKDLRELHFRHIMTSRSTLEKVWMLESPLPFNRDPLARQAVSGS